MTPLITSIMVCLNGNKSQLIVCNIYNILDIDVCASAPCQHGGTCTDKVNGYRCLCVSGYTGINCQTGMAVTTETVPTTPGKNVILSLRLKAVCMYADVKKRISIST